MRSALIRQLVELLFRDYAHGTLQLMVSVLFRLLKLDKRQTEVVLPWRALYDIFASVSFLKTFPNDLVPNETARLAAGLRRFIPRARRYFAPDCVPEMLELFFAGLVYPNHNEAERKRSSFASGCRSCCRSGRSLLTTPPGTTSL